jgi:hypothetical protein
MQFEERRRFMPRLRCPSIWTIVVYSARIFIGLIVMGIASVSLLPALLFLLFQCLRFNPIVAALVSIGGTIPLYIFVPTLFIISLYTAVGLEAIALLVLLVILYKERRA